MAQNILAEQIFFFHCAKNMSKNIRDLMGHIYFTQDIHVFYVRPLQYSVTTVYSVSRQEGPTENHPNNRKKKDTKKDMDTIIYVTTITRTRIEFSE